MEGVLKERPIDSIDQGENNYKKVRLFLEHNSNQKPQPNSSVLPTQQLREYLNDDDFTIYYEGENVFKSSEYAQKLDKLFLFWKQGAKEGASIDDFIKCWIINEKQLQVEYSLFDEFHCQAKGHTLASKEVNCENIVDGIKQEESAIQSYIPQKKISESQLVSMGLLQLFFTHYCKRQTTRISNSTFDQYQQQFNQMNLAKWMQFARDSGLSNFKKIYPNRKLKITFIKYQNNRKCLTFQTFKQALFSVLQTLFSNHPQDIPTEGYELVGIRNIENFNNKFRQLGLLPPPVNQKKLTKQRSLNKITLKAITNQNITNSTISIRSIEDLHLSSSSKVPTKTKIVLPLSKNTVPGSGELKDRKLDETDIKVISGNSEGSAVRQAITLSDSALNLSRIAGRRGIKVKVKEETFKQIIKEDEDDPYLRRYNHKQNINAYHSLIHRIDERVEKMCNKY